MSRDPGFTEIHSQTQIHPTDHCHRSLPIDHYHSSF